MKKTIPPGQPIDQIIRNAPVGIAVIDFDGIYLHVNPAYCKLYGYEEMELLGRSFITVFATEEHKRVLTLHQSFLRDGGVLKGEWDVIRHDGRHLNILSDSVRFALSDGKFSRLVYVIDNTARKQAERALQYSEQQLAGIIGSAMDAIVCINSAHRIVVFNPAAEAMFGYSAQDILGQPLDCLLPEDFRARHGHHIHGFAATGATMRKMGALGTLSAQRANGDIFPIEASISQVSMGEEVFFSAIIRDIGSRIKDHDALEFLAHHDALTKLPNRVLFADRLQQTLAQSQRRGNCVAVVYIDLDGFKLANDQHGHAIGDQLLQALAAAMRLAMREGDTLARIGGDEFIAAMGDLQSHSDCQPMLDRLLQAASTLLTIGGHRLQVSASMGVSIYPKDAGDVDQLTRCADQAMYVAKQLGKNRYHFFEATSP